LSSNDETVTLIVFERAGHGATKRIKMGISKVPTRGRLAAVYFVLNPDVQFQLALYLTEVLAKPDHYNAI
jgi:hypothetical protein